MVVPLMGLIETAYSQNLQKWYVDDDHPNTTQDGGLWSTAFNSLQDALDQASAWNALSVVNRSEIWVAEGTYYPSKYINPSSSTAPAAKTFIVPVNTRVIGGFQGNAGGFAGEALRSQRDGTRYALTRLDGDIPSAQQFPPSTVRVRHVVTCLSQTAEAQYTEIDGFQISGGYASGDTVMDNNGGGLFAAEANVVVRNCEFSGNFAAEDGGAIWWRNTRGVGEDNIGIVISRSRFLNNIAVSEGGAVHAYWPLRLRGYGQFSMTGTAPCIQVCEFDRNQAGLSTDPLVVPSQGGGAVYLFNPTEPMTIDGNVFSFNQARGWGSAVKMEFDYTGLSTVRPEPISFANNTFARNETAKLPTSVISTPIYSEPTPASPTPPTSTGTWTRPHKRSTNSGWDVGVTTTATALYPAAVLYYEAAACDLQGLGAFPTPLASEPNFDLDPMFENPLLNKFTLLPLSPCIDGGFFGGSSFTTRDLGDTNSNGVYGLETPMPLAMDTPGAFFKAHGLGVMREQNLSVDVGAMEQ